MSKMKNGRTVKLGHGLLLLVLAMVILVAAGCGQSTKSPASSSGSTSTSNSSTSKDASGGSVKLIYQSTKMENHGDEVFLRDNFFTPMEKASDGRLKFELHYNNELAPAKQGLDVLARGGIDLLMTAPSYFAGQVPIGTFSELPFNGTDMDDYELWNNKGIREIVSKSYEQKANAKVLFIEPLNPFLWVMRSGSEIKTLSDFKGKKIRTGGGLNSMAITLLGGTPVQVTTGDLYTSYKSGLIDGGSLPVSTAFEFKLDELSDSLTLPPYTTLNTMMVLVNLDSWKKVPKDLQDLIMDYVKNKYPALRAAHSEQRHKDNLEKWKAAGKKIYTLSAEDIRTQEKLMEQLAEEYIKKSGPDGQKIVDIIRNYESTKK